MRLRHWSLEGLVLPLNSAQQGQGDVWLITRKMKWIVGTYPSLRPMLVLKYDVLTNKNGSGLVKYCCSHCNSSRSISQWAKTPLCYTRCKDILRRLPCPREHIQCSQLVLKMWSMCSQLLWWAVATEFCSWLFHWSTAWSIFLHLSLLLFSHLQIGVLQFSIVDYFKGSRCHNGTTQHVKGALEG